MKVHWMLPILLPLFGSATLARAHEVALRCEVRPPDRVLVSVLFHSDDPAAGAALRMLDPHGHPVARGVTDEHGQYVFTATEAVAYSFEAIVAGHLVRGQLLPEQVARLNPGAATSDAPVMHSEPASPSGPRPHAEHGNAPEHAPAPAAFRDRPGARVARTTAVLAGLAFILSVAAFAMVYSLHRKLRAHLDQAHHQEADRT